MRRKIKFDAKKGITNIIKGIGVVVVGLASFEAGYIGTKALVEDCEFISNGVKELKNPTPIKVKTKGKIFSKKTVVSFNPFNGKAKPYRGTRKPINKKAIKL